MRARKTVLIPVIPLKRGPEARLLELIVEPRLGGRDGHVPSFDHLLGNGLGPAVAAATAALSRSNLSDVRLPACGAPTNEKDAAGAALFLANPMPALSNSEGAALGVALGLLMHRGLCPVERLLASGRLAASGNIVADSQRMQDRLAAARSLGPQRLTVPFVVPALPQPGTSTWPPIGQIIDELADINIQVIPTSSLCETVAACRRFARPGRPQRLLDRGDRCDG